MRENETGTIVVETAIGRVLDKIAWSAESVDDIRG